MLGLGPPHEKLRYGGAEHQKGDAQQGEAGSPVEKGDDDAGERRQNQDAEARPVGADRNGDSALPDEPFPDGGVADDDPEAGGASPNRTP